MNRIIFTLITLTAVCTVPAMAAVPAETQSSFLAEIIELVKNYWGTAYLVWRGGW